MTATTLPDDIVPALPARSRWQRTLPLQMLAGLVVGCILGLIFPDLGKSLLPLAQAFIKALRMMIIPLVFSLLLPLDEERAAGARLWAALIGRACVDEPTRQLAAEAYAGLTAFAVRMLSDALAGTETGAGDVAQSARHLVSVVEGLRWPVLFGVYGRDEALGVLDAQLDLVLGADSGG